MIRKILCIVLGVLFFMSFTAESAELKMADNQTECDRNEKLLGGWNKTEVTPEVESALDFVLKQMNTSAKLEKILGVKTQVVAGINYAIDFQLDNGEVWNTLVFRDLSGNYVMINPATKGTVTNICP